MTLQADEYERLRHRLHERISETTPPGAVVAVVSRGDDELVDLPGRRGWHFPRLATGSYAGHHPADAEAVIRHINAVRDDGAEFLVLPSTSMWWLDHYAGLGVHLKQNHRVVARDDDVGLIVALIGASTTRDAASYGLRSSTPLLGDIVGERHAEDFRLLFDLPHYEAQTGKTFSDVDAAALHFLRTGAARGHDPSPLFDTEWYVASSPLVAASGMNPLLHFLTHGVQRGLDPSPYFDTDYYYEQCPSLRAADINALVHYVRQVNDGGAPEPNPLFSQGYYYAAYPAARGSGRTPLADFLVNAEAERRLASRTHHSVLDHLRRSGRSALLRGSWRSGTVLFFAAGDDRDVFLHDLAEVMAAELHIETIVVTTRSAPADVDAQRKVLELDAFALSADLSRPSAVRLLTKVLTHVQPTAAVVADADLITTLRSTQVPTLYLANELMTTEDGGVVPDADRVLLPTASLFQALRTAEEPPPLNFAYRPLPTGGDELRDYARWLLSLAEGATPRPATTVSAPRRRVFIPCSDWGVSGVNAALDALGQELIALGWDVEILFTRDASYWTRGDSAPVMPSIPYRLLARAKAGTEGLWEALIAEVEKASPCCVLLAYDFVANAAIPAFSDEVGVVMWVQADDADYYEQAYRLGRYANAIVCVSEHIRGEIEQLNPAFRDRLHVVHNSSVWRKDVATRRSMSKRRLDIVYTGRLVQYQKRILDFVQLARSLDEIGYAYRLTLIGTFSGREGTEATFRREAREHLADGRIVLPGRLPRQAIFEELSAHAFFVLLSEFEGLPLALVEAMAQGCIPISAEMASGIPEIITDGDNGLIMTHRDYAKWAQVLVDLWSEPKRVRRMSAAARRTVRHHLTVEQAGQQFDRIFEKLSAEATNGGFHRPPALHWGQTRSQFGDVLPPPSMLGNVNFEGLT